MWMILQQIQRQGRQATNIMGKKGNCIFWHTWSSVTSLSAVNSTWLQRRSTASALCLHQGRGTILTIKSQFQFYDVLCLAMKTKYCRWYRRTLQEPASPSHHVRRWELFILWVFLICHHTCCLEHMTVTVCCSSSSSSSWPKMYLHSDRR